MPFIDNQSQTMVQALRNALETSDRVDIVVGYFYFSGFQLLAESLKDKKVRILVGKELDPTCIPEIVQYSRDQEISLERYQLRRPSNSSLQTRQNYLDALVGFVNDSDTFDSVESTQRFEMFISKILDGSLEIRKTINDYHGKLYLLHNRRELSHNGDFPGTIFHGSSNFTYNGLSGQDELNEVSKEKSKFEDAQQIFEKLWTTSESISIADSSNAEQFASELREKLWIYQEPSPRSLYLRVLSEIYGNLGNQETLRTPSEITGGSFIDLEYQKDAVKFGLDRISKFDGVIIADVVGLGKSIIAAAIARNLDIDTLIVAPPHLIEEWESYCFEFSLRGSRVMSAGNIKAIHEIFGETRKPLLIIIDEAHRFRNEDTGDYQLLHQICRGNPDNKVILLTATPFNNSPKDVLALIKLFQTPGQSTIKSVDNLSMRFGELIRRYMTLRRALQKISKDQIDRETFEIAEEQRRILEPVVIRRSRLDLQFVTRYRKDLERQGIRFPKVIGPQLLEYDLGSLAELYVNTLDKIGNPLNPEGFKGARYKPTTYIKDFSKLDDVLGSEIEHLDLSIAQTNIADQMRRLLVTRFESSRHAFRISLNRMILNNELVLSWWNDLGIVPIMKKGQLPDPTLFLGEDGQDIDEFEEMLESLRERRGLIEIPRELVDRQFVDDVKSDIKLLRSIESQWFSEKLGDPKVERLIEVISELRSENPDRKIVIFSAYADSVAYLNEKLTEHGIEGVLKYSSSDASKENRRRLRRNFDASLREAEQENDFSLLVCTDALGEGINLNRAGVIINFDIPYNPTKVIQRVGRINRINKMMYPEIYIYNCFPTVLGEAETRIRTISTLKISLINNVIGTDTRTLTPDEDVQSFFVDVYSRTEKSEEPLSWEATHLEEFEKALLDREMMAQVANIPRRSRIARIASNLGNELAVVFSKRGPNHIFIAADGESTPRHLSLQEGISLFQASPEEKGIPVTAGFPRLFSIAYEKLTEKHPVPEMRGRRTDALKVLEAVRFTIPSAEAYCADVIKVISKYDDLSDGTLKEIIAVDTSEPERCLAELKKLVPESYVRNILERVHRMANEAEVILLGEEFKG